MSLYPEITEPVPTLYERCVLLCRERDYLREVAKTLAARVHQNKEAATILLDNLSAKLRESHRMHMEVELKVVSLQSQLAETKEEYRQLFLRHSQVVFELQAEERDNHNSYDRIADLESQLAVARTLLLEVQAGCQHETAEFVENSLHSEMARESSLADDLDKENVYFLSHQMIETVLKPTMDVVDLFPDVPLMDTLEPTSSNVYMEEVFDSSEVVRVDFGETENVVLVHSDGMDACVPDATIGKSDLDELEAAEDTSILNESVTTDLVLLDNSTIVLETSNVEVVVTESPEEQLRRVLAGKTIKDLNALSVADLSVYLGWIGQAYVKPKAKSIAILRNALIA